MTNRLNDARKLIAAKTYILITETESVIAGNLNGLSGFMKIHTLQGLRQQVDKMLRQYANEDILPNAKDVKKGDKHARVEKRSR